MSNGNHGSDHSGESSDGASPEHVEEQPNHGPDHIRSVSELYPGQLVDLIFGGSDENTQQVERYMVVQLNAKQVVRGSLIPDVEADDKWMLVQRVLGDPQTQVGARNMSYRDEGLIPRSDGTWSQNWLRRVDTGPIVVV